MNTNTQSVSTADRQQIEAIVAALEAAWNAGDGIAFAAPFAEDADFVTVRAEHFRGREAIGAGHAGIFRSVFANSTIRCTLQSVRPLGPAVAVIHATSVVDVPAGPLAGRQSALFSAVLVRDGGELGSRWQIVAFHNTQAPPAART